jgi:hypothetical protein
MWKERNETRKKDVRKIKNGGYERKKGKKEKKNLVDAKFDAKLMYSIAVLAQSVQRWATDWTIGVLGFDSRCGLGIFLFTTASRTALGPTHPPIQWVPRALSLGVKRPGSEADHSPPSSAEVKNTWSYTSTSAICLHGVVLS